jgi:hypothetical protein
MRLWHGAGVLVLFSAGSLAGQTQTERDVLDRATDWAHRFVEAYSNVVAEEIYVQETTSPQRKRTLRSDYLLVRFPGTADWHAFRDVLEVDGGLLPAEGRAERLAKLFLEPPENARRRIEDIARAGARYNLAEIGTLNEPLRVLAYMQMGYREQFRFIATGIDEELGPAVRIVRFEEMSSPTILRGPRNTDSRSFGLVWIDEPTGRIVKTELRPGRFTPATTRVTTTFRFDEQLGIDVPATMEEVYPDRNGEIRGRATYGRFRRFHADARETIDVPANPR